MDTKIIKEQLTSINKKPSFQNKEKAKRAQELLS
jgi:hypothetical protein